MVGPVVQHAEQILFDAQKMFCEAYSVYGKLGPNLPTMLTLLMAQEKDRQHC